MSKCIRNTIVDSAKIPVKFLNEDRTEAFIPTQKNRTIQQAYNIAKSYLDKINKIFGKFGQNASLNTTYTNGVGLNIHPTKNLIDAYEVKEGNKTIEEYNITSDWVQKSAERKVFNDRHLLGIDEFGDSNPLYSLATSEMIKLHPINMKFNRDWDNYIKNTEDFKNFEFELGVPSSILQKVGFPNRRIVLQEKRIDHIEAQAHDLNLKNLFNLVEKIHDPLMVFKTETGSLELLTELENDRGRKIHLIFELNKTSKGLEVVKLSTAFVPHKKDNNSKFEYGLSRILSKIRDGKVLYADKQKVNVIMRGYRSKPDMSYPNMNIDSDANIQKVLDFIKSFNNPITTEEQRYQRAISQNNENQLISDKQIEEAKSKLKQILPQIPVEIVDDYIQVVYNSDAIAVGKFEKGLITLSKKSSNITSTAFHEAFHGVMDILKNINPELYEKALDEGSKRYGIKRGESKASSNIRYEGDLAIEEKLAEEFQKDTSTDIANTWFERLRQWINNMIDIIKNKSIIDNLFRDIRQGRYRDVSYQNSQVKPDNNDINTKYSIENENIKPGVEEVFNENPELYRIGTLEQYSQYLDTIFPNSKVKDIVYHGTKSEKFDKFDKSFSGTGSNNSINTQDIFFIKYKEATKTFGPNLISALINIKNPNIIPLDEFNKNWNNKEIYDSQRIGDGIIGEELKSPQEYYNEALAEYNKDPNDKFARKPRSVEDFIEEQLSTTYVVFEPEQIHILSSKADIQGFKDFVQGKQFQKLTAEEKAKTIEQVTKEHRSITTLKDLSAKLAHRIGGKVEFQNRADVDWKGYNQGMTSVLNEAYMDESTAFHEILAHPIIRAIKNKNLNKVKTDNYNIREFTYKGDVYKTERDIFGYSYKNGKEISDSEFDSVLTQYLKEGKDTELYQSLLKELETGRGKEVFEQVKRDYKNKTSLKKYKLINEDYDNVVVKPNYLSKTFNSEKEAYDYVKKIEPADQFNVSVKLIETIPQKYTLEEQQEEAIVQLVSLMAAGKLDAKKDATLISKLKALWKQISDFVKSLLRQDGIKIDELPITTTLNDLAEIMAYGDNKIILPGYKIEYSTPLGNKYDTLEEVNNEIRGLADANVEVDLSGVNIYDSKITKDNLPKDFIKTFGVSSGSSVFLADSKYNDEFNEKNRLLREKYKDKFVVAPKDKYGLYLDRYNENQVFYNTKEEAEEKTLELSIEEYNKNNQLSGFIEKNKEYEQSREIIEQWKKENNIQYDPEEVYSRGQEFYHIHNAYSRNHVDTELWIQNLLETIQDKAKIGAKIEMSFATAPKGEVGKGLQHHNKKTKQTVYITSYPKSEDIEFVSQIDNHTSSFTDLTVDMIKAFTNQKNERVGIALTKSVPTRNLHTIQPNLATTVDDVAHHNEIVIGLTPYNFRISYEENVPYETKKLIDNVNKILDAKYGKLVKPEIKKEVSIQKQYRFGNETYDTYQEAKAEVDKFIGTEQNEILGFDYSDIVEIQKPTGKQAKLTKENTTSIQSVRDKSVKNYTDFKDLKTGNSLVFKEDGFENNKVGDTIRYNNNEYIVVGEVKENPEFPPQWELKLKEKEYTSQAEINLKVAALKEVARKYPRSLITSKVVPINPNMLSSDNASNKYYSLRNSINYWEEPGFMERNPNFNPEAYINDQNKFGEDFPLSPEMTPYLTEEPYGEQITNIAEDYWEEDIDNQLNDVSLPDQWDDKIQEKLFNGEMQQTCE